MAPTRPDSGLVPYLGLGPWVAHGNGAPAEPGGEDGVELVVLEPADGQDLAALNRSRVADLKRAVFLSLSFRNGFFTATTLNVGSSFLTLAIPM